MSNIPHRGHYATVPTYPLSAPNRALNPQNPQVSQLPVRKLSGPCPKSGRNPESGHYGSDLS